MSRYGQENSSWRELISEELEMAKETWADLVSITLSEDELDVRFYQGFGGAEGKPFTMWTHLRVYFPVEYDGSEHVSSVARFPDGKPTEHIG